MPKIKIQAGANLASVDAAKGFYAGDVPPRGLYRCRTKLFKIVENSSGNQMFKIVFEIAEPKGSKKSKYNGYGIWHNANLTEKSAPFVNAMLDALEIPRKAVWGGVVITSKTDDEKVLKIGSKSVLDIEVLVNTKREQYKGDDKLTAVSFLPASAADEDDESDDEDEDEDEDSPETDEDDDEDSDDDDDEDEDDDESF